MPSRLLLVIALVLAITSQLFLLSSTKIHDLRDFLLAYPNDLPTKQTHELPPRLEYFHLPKSGGTYLEYLAGRHNITWGACHFKAIVLTSPKPQWKNAPPWPSCPSLPYNQTFPRSIGLNYWHFPLYMLSRYMDFEPYDIVHPDLLERPKRFFTVIRNPYDRIVSLYYYYKGFNKTSTEANNATRLNEFVLKHIRNQSCPQTRACIQRNVTCHGLFACATQYDYIYDDRGNQVIDYVLHYETLQAEFSNLSTVYELNFTIQDKPPEKKQRLLTVANLSDESLVFINRHFRKDFALGRGYQMRHPTRITSSSNKRPSNITMHETDKKLVAKDEKARGMNKE